MADLMNVLKSNPIVKILTQIEQNTRSEKTAVLYKTRQELGVDKVSSIECPSFLSFSITQGL